MWDWRANATGLEVMLTPTASASAIAARQRSRLVQMLQWAAARSRLYGERLQRTDLARAALGDLPPVTKPELMHRFDEWVTDRRLVLPELLRFVDDAERIGQPLLERYQVWESSGSSGERGVFVQDEESLAVYDALEACRRQAFQPWRRALDPMYATERIAFVGATTGHFASTAWVRRLCRLNPWLAGAVRSHSFLQPLESLVRALQLQAPTVLTTYPTAALMLAEEAQAGRLRIPLREIWTGGEALTETMRGFISRAFGCPVAQSYGASEFLSIASECRFHQMHVNADWVILESVDESHRPVPDGEMGHTTLLTHLANRVQPLVRYDLGDRIALHTSPCRCGSALPRVEVRGRVDDSVVLRNRSGRKVRLMPLALTTVLEEGAGLYDFRLVQQGEHGLLLQVGPGDAEGEAMAERGRAALADYLRTQGLANVALQCRSGERGTCARSGKLPRVVADTHAS